MTKKIMVGLALAAASAVPAFMAAAPASAAPATHLVGLFPNQGPAANGGYMLYSNGRVVPVGGAAYYGSALGHGNNFVSLVSDSSNPGYWEVTSTGKAYSVGQTCSSGETLQGARPHGTVIGAVNPTGSTDEGFDLVTASGRTYEWQCNFNF
jgi:hypothetical protein